MAAKSKFRIVKKQKSPKPVYKAKDPILSGESKKKILNSISIKLTVSKEKIKVKLTKYSNVEKKPESLITSEEVYMPDNRGSEMSDLSPLCEAASGEFNTVAFLPEIGGSNIPDESVNGSKVSE